MQSAVRAWNKTMPKKIFYFVHEVVKRDVAVPQRRTRRISRSRKIVTFFRIRNEITSCSSWIMPEELDGHGALIKERTFMARRRKNDAPMKSTADEPLGGASPLDLDVSQPKPYPSRVKWLLRSLIAVILVALFGVILYVTTLGPI